jgi:insertion element IS1 protein InsB
MILEAVHCPNCNGIEVIKHVKTAEGKQRYYCQNLDCERRTFIREYRYAGYSPQVKQQISDMATNGSGIRDTARILGIRTTTVMETLKKSSELKMVHEALLDISII